MKKLLFSILISLITVLSIKGTTLTSTLVYTPEMALSEGESESTDPSSVNELHVDAAVSGNYGDIVTVMIRLQNSEPIRGIEVDFVLPPDLEFVKESETSFGRASRFFTNSNFIKDKIKILVYPFTADLIVAGNDNILSFELKLTGKNGVYDLLPSNVILSNINNKNIVTGSSGKYVQIKAPEINAPTSLSFGDVALMEQAEAFLEISNVGALPLTIENVYFSGDIFSCGTPLPLSIETGSSASVRFLVNPIKPGALSATANIYSDDPTDSPFEVVLNATGIQTTAESISIICDSDPVLKATESLQLSALVLPETTIDKSVRWESENPDVASVSQDGLVTAVSVGTTDITATNSAGQTDRIKITVNPTPVSQITLSREQVILQIPETVLINAEVFPSTATEQSLIWSSSQPDIASVSQEGLVTALSPGNAIITALASDGSNVYAECNVTVEEIPVSSITLNMEMATIRINESLNLIATIHPETITDRTVEWNSSDSFVATVDEHGEVKGVTPGIATITASCGEVDASCLVTVTDFFTSVGHVPGETDFPFNVCSTEGVLILKDARETELSTLKPGLYIIVYPSGSAFKYYR